MLKLRYLIRFSPYYTKPILAIHVIMGQCEITSIKTRIWKLRRFTTVYLLIRALVKIEANQGKFWVRPKRILVSIAKASKSRPPSFPPLAIILLLSRKIKKKVIKISAESNIISITTRLIKPTSVLTKSQKTSVGLGDFYSGDYG